MFNPVPLPVHPDERGAHSDALHRDVDRRGFAAVQASLVARFTDTVDASDSLERRLERNLGVAFDIEDLESFAIAELSLVLRTIARGRGPTRDLPPGAPGEPTRDPPIPMPSGAPGGPNPNPPGVPGGPPVPGLPPPPPPLPTFPDEPHGTDPKPPADAPGAQELFDAILDYHNFREWAQIFWGRDWIDIILDERMLYVGEAWYEWWLEEHVLMLSEFDRFQAFLDEIGLSITALLEALHGTFSEADELLLVLLDDLGKWFFRMFGLSP